MKVVGGTYLEEVETPRDVDLGGSGLRAARAMTGWRRDVELHSCVDSVTQEVADAAAVGSGLSTRWYPRDREVSYVYANPLFLPERRGQGVCASPFAVEDDAVLAFSMVEAKPEISAGRLVFDVQGVTDWREVQRSIGRANRVAVLVNARELQRLTNISEPEEAATKLLELLDVETVVCKRAAAGVLTVSRRGRRELIGPYPTDRVWPIGSGDVFAAGFAHAWLRGAEPRIAARRGSWAASVWCSQRRLGTDQAQQTSRKQPPLPPVPGRIYLAGPFFDLGQRHVINSVRAALLDLGGRVFSPLHDVGIGGQEAGVEDLRALESCTAMLALLDGEDPGTILECGWAAASDIPVIGYAERLGREARTMLGASGAQILDDLPSAAYRALWRSMGL